MKLLLRRAEARRILGLGEKALNGLIRKKELNPLYPGGKLMFFRTLEVMKIGGLKNEEDIKKVVGQFS